MWTLFFRRQRRDFLRRGEQGSDLDVEAEIGERRGDDLLAAVVAVLADLGHENARPTAVVLGEGARHRDDALVGLGAARPIRRDRRRRST